MTRARLQSLLRSGLSHSELLIVFYLIDMCNEWGFTKEDYRSVARFFDSDPSNISRRIKKLRDLDIVKTVEYNGRTGLMVNPDYCYQGPLHLRRFRINLWSEGKFYTRKKPRYFYGPPEVESSEQTWKNLAILKNKGGRFSHIRRIELPPRTSSTDD